MKSDKIVVIGSSNTDMVIKSARLPKPGETVIGNTFLMNPGGKGANQAVAAARMGAKVTFISKVGNDAFGKQAIEGYNAAGINTEYTFTDQDYPSGIALILVDAKGENSIAVAPGANANLHPADIDLAKDQIENAAVALLQLEIPIATVEYAADIAQKSGVRVILNPAPAQTLSEKLLKSIYMLIPNKTEAEMLTGIAVTGWDSAARAADALSEKGVANTVITLGAQGALVKEGSQYHRIVAELVDAVDTTAAGDTFCGALCAGLCEGMTIADSVRLACRASSISVTRMGAQSSIPYRHEI